MTSHQTRPVVLIAEELSPATVEALGPGLRDPHCNGADRAELLAGDRRRRRDPGPLGDQGRRRGAGRGPRLKVIARAGVGLDNVDVKAATQAGVMVVNAPTSNIVSAAELAVALMLAAARHLSPAHAALKNGEWKRSKYTGIELYEKTVGIVGLGRIGVLVAQRLSAFGMNVIAYDPYVQAGRAAQMGVRLVDLDTLLAESDFMSVHLPKTPETVGLIGVEQLAQGQAVAGPRQRRPRRDRRRGRALRRPQGGPDRRPPASTSSRPSRAPTARSSSSRTSSRRRTSARRPTRPRRRPASPSPARSGSRCPASWCPTPSTSRAA